MASWTLYGGMCYCYSTSPSSSSREGSSLWGGMSSFIPGCLCESSLDNTWGVFVCIIVDGWAVFDVIPVPIICSTGVLGLRGVGFGFGVKVLGVVLGMGVGVGVSSFLRNRRFLKVILLGPSTVLVVGECFNDLTCCVPSAGCWSLYCHYLPLLKGT